MHSYILGFKILVLPARNVKSLMPCDLSLHRKSRKNKYGLNEKETKRQDRTHLPEDSYGCGRFDELDKEKTTVAIEMLNRAVQHGILAQYVLMYSWFVTDGMIKRLQNKKRKWIYKSAMIFSNEMKNRTLQNISVHPFR